MSKQLKREGIEVARCTVERMMRKLGLERVRRGTKVRTTVPDTHAPSSRDRLHRQSARAAHRVAACGGSVAAPFPAGDGFPEFLSRARRRRDHHRQTGRLERGRRVQFLATVAPVRAQRVDARIADRHVALLVALADHLEQSTGRRVDE
ncbi:IS3 family transposase [Burkholderia territorii]|uniref:IS3 family transposase n=1 Tax=Burkholderia territorii TaxID=1503055 RepID=UPI0039BF593F